jgi:hypothetical protein
MPFFILGRVYDVINSCRVSGVVAYAECQPVEHQCACQLNQQRTEAVEKGKNGYETWDCIHQTYYGRV